MTVPKCSRVFHGELIHALHEILGSFPRIQMPLPLSHIGSHPTGIEDCKFYRSTKNLLANESDFYYYSPYSALNRVHFINNLT